MDEIRIGVVGLGIRGNTHFKIFKSIENVRIVGIFDIDSEKTLSFAKKWNVIPYLSYNEMLRDSKIDAIVISTPDHTHAKLTLKAINFGKHVLCEIPMAYTYEEVFEIVKAVEREEIIYLLGQEVRYWPVFRKIKELVEDNFFGEIFYAETEYLHNLEELIKKTPWRRKQTTMLGGGPHAVDILQWIIGDLIEVFAYSMKTIKTQLTDDFTIALYKSDKGTIGRVVVAYGIKRPYSLSIRIYGTKASFEQDTYPWSYKSGFLFDVNRGGRLILKEEKTPIISHGCADYLQALNFINSIKGLEKPLIDVYEAAKITNACIAALESSLKNKVIKIPIVGG